MTTNYSKTELARDLADRTGMNSRDATAALDAAIACIREATDAGKTVNLPGFGKFEVKHRAARTGRNPATGEPVEIAASRKLAFRPSKQKA